MSFAEKETVTWRTMLWKGPRLVDILEVERNSFNLIRLVAALAVLVSHAFAINSAIDAPEPLQGTTPFTLGGHAVNAFFVVSGLTLSHSLERNPSLSNYILARALRLLPLQCLFFNRRNIISISTQYRFVSGTFVREHGSNDSTFFFLSSRSNLYSSSRSLGSCGRSDRFRVAHSPLPSERHLVRNLHLWMASSTVYRASISRYRHHNVGRCVDSYCSALWICFLEAR